MRHRYARFLETVGFWASVITVCTLGLVAGLIIIGQLGRGCA